jgi:sarcosine/dimethylglycine N-methyltransferase
MMPGQRVEDHYAAAGTGSEIATRIIEALRGSAGADVAITPDTLAPSDHVHGRGVLATRELAMLLEPEAAEAILDIGSGIGGPARWIAAKYDCLVTGVDLTTEFCDAARALNAACGMSERIRIIQGSALALPLPDACFDRAYSHNVVMNIADKGRVYREAFRVLKPGGRLVLCHINAGPNGPPEFPVPWAMEPRNSFLATDDETRGDLVAAGFEILAFRDTTQEHLSANVDRLQKLATEALPPVGVHLLMGDLYRQCLTNSLRAADQGRARTVEVVVQKPG